jgi:3-oxoacyl-[acyl-carrier-protein] synthase III
VHTLDVLGVGMSVPPSESTIEVCQAAGADTSGYRGWERVCIARGDDHPSTMGTAALEAALVDAGVRPDQLKLVVSAGMSRDHLPSWSLSTEIMKSVGTAPDCLGLDITSGCLGTLAALDLLLGWLAVRGGGYAALVAAERWAYTIDRSTPTTMSLWAHSDGGGALIVGIDTDGTPIMSFHGAEFVSASELNGRVLVKYGGTRFPQAPEGENPNFRSLGHSDPKLVRAKYQECYEAAFEALGKRFGGPTPTSLVCNQITPGVVRMLTRIVDVTEEQTVVTGHEMGHMGPVDVIAGIDRLRQTNGIEGVIAVASSTPYAFGAGLFSKDGNLL